MLAFGFSWRKPEVQYYVWPLFCETGSNGFVLVGKACSTRVGCFSICVFHRTCVLAYPFYVIFCCWRPVSILRTEVQMTVKIPGCCPSPNIKDALVAFLSNENNPMIPCITFANTRSAIFVFLVLRNTPFVDAFWLFMYRWCIYSLFFNRTEI